MNMTMVDLSECDTSLDIGEEVVLIGTQGTQTISLEELAESINTIPYEVCTRIQGASYRVKVSD